MELDRDLYQNPKLVTVFGGSGFVGRHVVEALTKRGYRVRVAVRYPEKSYYLMQIGEVGQVQMLKTDVLVRDSVARALRDADAAVFLPGVFFSSGKNNCENVHIEGARNVAELAKSANIMLIHMSALGANTQSPINYLRTKALGEEAVARAHERAITIRPSLIFGPEDQFFNKFANLARFLSFMPIFNNGNAKIQPVYVGDVAKFIVASLENRVAHGSTYELGGREVVTVRDALQLMLNIIGRKKRFVNLPSFIATVTGKYFGLLARIPMMPKVTNDDQIKMLLVDNVVSREAEESGRTLARAGISPKSMEAVLPAYLWRFRPHGQFAKNVTPDWSR